MLPIKAAPFPISSVNGIATLILFTYNYCLQRKSLLLVIKYHSIFAASSPAYDLTKLQEVIYFYCCFASVISCEFFCLYSQISLILPRLITELNISYCVMLLLHLNVVLFILCLSYKSNILRDYVNVVTPVIPVHTGINYY
jgi:hypothetical protein